MHFRSLFLVWQPACPWTKQGKWFSQGRGVVAGVRQEGCGRRGVVAGAWQEGCGGRGRVAGVRWQGRGMHTLRQGREGLDLTQPACHLREGCCPGSHGT